MKSWLILPAFGSIVLAGVACSAESAPGGSTAEEVSLSNASLISVIDAGSSIDDPHEVEMLRLLSRAEGLLRLGRTKAAAAIARRLPTHGPHATPARRVRAWSLHGSGAFGELLELLEDENALDDELKYLRGSAAWQVGERQRALTDLRALWWGSPNGVWGAAALREMASDEPKPATFYRKSERALIRKQLSRATIDTRTARHPLTGTALTAMLNQAPKSGMLAAELQHAAGVALLRSEKFTLAVSAFRDALKLTRGRALRRVIELRLGESERRRGSYKAAQRYFAAVAQSGQDTFTVEALAAAGQMAIEYRRYNDALRHFEAELVNNPVGPARHAALWGLGWVAFRTGDLRAARRFFETLCAEAPFGDLAARCTYWGARALDELGHRDAASFEMAALLERFPVDYYAYRAERWLDGRQPPSGIATLPAPATPRRVAHLRALLEAGMQRRARKSLLRLRRDARTLGPDNLEILERASVELGMPQTAATFAKARQSRFPSDASAVDRLSAQFPKPYVALLAKRAKKERLDVEIPVAVVYQESRFNPRAVSPVGALGLMQLMPATARGLFKEEKRRKSPTTADILDPANNTRLGVRYLARMLRAFDRRTEYALAAYNAGPGAVTRWRQARGDLPVEIFVEEIPYRETRQYVRKVLAGLQTFRFVQRARQPTSRQATAELASAEPPTAR